MCGLNSDYFSRAGLRPTGPHERFINTPESATSLWFVYSAAPATYNPKLCKKSENATLHYSKTQAKLTAVLSGGGPSVRNPMFLQFRCINSATKKKKRAPVSDLCLPLHRAKPINHLFFPPNGPRGANHNTEQNINVFSG